MNRGGSLLFRRIELRHERPEVAKLSRQHSEDFRDFRVVDSIAHNLENSARRILCIKIKISRNRGPHMIEKASQMTFLGRRPRHMPVFEENASDESRKLGREMNGIFRRNSIS